MRPINGLYVLRLDLSNLTSVVNVHSEVATADTTSNNNNATQVAAGGDKKSSKSKVNNQQQQQQQKSKSKTEDINTDASSNPSPPPLSSSGSIANPAMILDSCRLLCRLRFDGVRCGSISGSVKLVSISDPTESFSNVRALLTNDGTWSFDNDAGYAIDSDGVMNVEFGVVLDRLDGVLLQVAQSLVTGGAYSRGNVATTTNAQMQQQQQQQQQDGKDNNSNNNNNNNNKTAVPDPAAAVVPTTTNNNNETSTKNGEALSPAAAAAAAAAAMTTIAIKFVGTMCVGQGVGKALVSSTGSMHQTLTSSDLRMVMTEVVADRCVGCGDPLHLDRIGAPTLTSSFGDAVAAAASAGKEKKDDNSKTTTEGEDKGQKNTKTKKNGSSNKNKATKWKQENDDDDDDDGALASSSSSGDDKDDDGHGSSSSSSLLSPSPPPPPAAVHPDCPDCLEYCSSQCRDHPNQQHYAKILLPHLKPYATARAARCVANYKGKKEFTVFWRSVTATTFLILVSPSNPMELCYEMMLDVLIEAKDGLRINMISSPRIDDDDDDGDDKKKNKNDEQESSQQQTQKKDDDHQKDIIALNFAVYEAVIRSAVSNGCVALAAACLNQLHVWCDAPAFVERQYLNFYDFCTGGGWDGLRLVSTLGEYVMLVRPMFECAAVLIEAALKSTLASDFWYRLENAKGVLISLYNINGSVSFTPAVQHLRSSIVPEQQRETLLLLAKVFILMAARAPEEQAQRMLNRAEECYTDAIEEDRLRQNLRRMALTTLNMAALRVLCKDTTGARADQLRDQGIALLQSVAASPAAFKHQHQHCISTIVSTIGTSDELGLGAVASAAVTTAATTQPVAVAADGGGETKKQ